MHDALRPPASRQRVDAWPLLFSFLSEQVPLNPKAIDQATTAIVASSQSPSWKEDPGWTYTLVRVLVLPGAELHCTLSQSLP